MRMFTPMISSVLLLSLSTMCHTALGFSLQAPIVNLVVKNDSRTDVRMNMSKKNEVEDLVLGGNVGVSRRSVLQAPLFAALAGATAIMTQEPLPATAKTGEKIAAKLTVEEAEAQYKEGYKTITYLLDNYSQVCEGGGDNVRRYLGTIVGNPPSPLVGIGKVMAALEDRADDFIEYKEMSNEVITSINQADGSAYMSIFVTTSTSYTPPQKYFDDAKIEVKRCKKAMKELAAMVDVKLE